MKPLLRYGHLFYVMVMLVGLAGCSSVRLIAEYDELIDQQVTEIYRQMESQLVFLERYANAEEAKYEQNTDFYDGVKIDLRSLKVRAAAHPKNDITLQQIDLLVQNVELMQQMHQAGISQNDIPPLRKAFEVSTTAIIKLELAKRRGEKMEQ